MPLLALSDDALGVIFEGSRNTLDPRDAVGFGSVSHRLWALTQALRKQLRTEHEAAAILGLCHTLGLRSCKELREAKKVDWENTDLFAPGSARRAVRRAARRYSAAADLTTLGMLGSLLPALQQLLLANFLAHDCVQQLAAGLGAGALPAVIFLSITNMHVGDAGASALAAALGRGALPRLKILFLPNVGIGDAGLVALAPALRRLPALEVLYLNGNLLGDEGIAALVAPPPAAGALSLPAGALTKLKSIGLGYTRVTDAGCASLAAALDSGALPALEQLGLSSVVWPPTASAAARAAVQQALLQAQMRELIQEALLRAVVREVVQEAAVAAVQRAATAALEEEARKKEAHAERFVDFNEAAFLRASAATGGIGPYDDGDVDEAVGSV